MAIPPDQAEEVKRQLIEQIEKSGMENKEQIKSYILGMNEAELETFLKQNKIQIAGADSSAAGPGMPSECVFCSIISNKIPSYKLADTKNEIAILEINPLSRGHSIVLPKEHGGIETITKSALSLAQKIAKKIKKKLKPDEIKIETSGFMGHSMINIIPIYKDTPLKKTKAEERDLDAVQSKLETKLRAKRKPKEKKSTSEKPATNLFVVKRRIP